MSRIQTSPAIKSASPDTPFLSVTFSLLSHLRNQPLIAWKFTCPIFWTSSSAFSHWLERPSLEPAQTIFQGFFYLFLLYHFVFVSPSLIRFHYKKFEFNIVISKVCEIPNYTTATAYIFDNLSCSLNKPSFSATLKSQREGEFIFERICSWTRYRNVNS